MFKAVASVTILFSPALSTASPSCPFKADFWSSFKLGNPVIVDSASSFTVTPSKAFCASSNAFWAVVTVSAVAFASPTTSFALVNAVSYPFFLSSVAYL